MNAIVKIDGADLEAARLNRESIIALTESPGFEQLGRVEVVDGVLIQMSPAWMPHAEAHAKIHVFFAVQLGAAFKITIDQLVLFGDHGLHAPDIAFFDLSLTKRRPESSDLLMAVEISVDSLDYDLGTKAGRFAAFAIPEYWVVDVESRRLIVHRDPQPNGYATVITHKWSDSASPLIAPDLAVKLDEIIPA